MSGRARLTAEDIAWFRQADSLPASARAAATALARSIGLDERRTAEVALGVTEAATNLRRHAVDGALLLRVVRSEAAAAVEFLAVDAGPGIADLSRAMTDGASSAGTLGIGMGAIARLADDFDIYSLPGRGTAMSARFWGAGRRPAPGPGPLVTGLTRPISGEDVCGDIWAVRVPAPPAGPGTVTGSSARRAEPAVLDWAALTAAARPGADTTAATGIRPTAAAPRRADETTPPPAEAAGAEDTLVMLCDGLGHGPLAALASKAATEAFAATRHSDPLAVLQDLHRALRGTRGAAVAVAHLSPAERRVRLCGVGNVSAYVVDHDVRRALLSTPGIVGHHLGNPRATELPLPPGGALVMHSDGLSERWNPADFPGLWHHEPLVAAGQLLREAGHRRDDVGIVVARTSR
ncbi:SpoIIE family protein phosphatase [Kitasatospora sp. NPDC101801]|uniref:SpoIIE family protein phosphatase n=1 Tax=Kitasatospora sp. NPDC101801 TaxID=3364103 RepID=UPI003817D6E6